MRLRHYISVLAGGAGLLLFFAHPTHAQQTLPGDQLSLGVSPAITELIVDPGESKQIEITVKNLTNKPLPIKAIANAFIPTEEVAEKDRAIFDASLWVQLSEPDFILQAQQQRNIIATVTPPPNAEPGGHYATIFFQPLAPVAADGEIAAYLGTKVGVLSLMIVKGDFQEKLTIGNISAPIFSQHGPVELSVDVQNIGSVHLMPNVTIEIYNIWGERVETLSVPPTLVLPKTTKKITTAWDSKKRFGYYTAKAVVAYGATHQILDSKPMRMIILPWSIVWIAAVLGIMSFIGWRARGRWKRAFRILIHNK